MGLSNRGPFSHAKTGRFASSLSYHRYRTFTRETCLKTGKGEMCLSKQMSPLQNPFKPGQSACAPLFCKNMCCVSRFCTPGGELRAADPSNVQGPVKQNAVPGDNLRLRDQGGSRGQEQQPGPENQDSQHMLKQPRGISLSQSFQLPNRERERLVRRSWKVSFLFWGCS